MSPFGRLGMVSFLLHSVCVLATSGAAQGLPHVDRESSRILFLSSYDPSFPTFEQQVAGLRSVLPTDEFLIEFEFMDAKRLPTPRMHEIFEAMLRYKLGNLETFDLVMAADDAALEFAISRRRELFPGVPIAFLGANDHALARSATEDPLVAGVLESISPQENLDLMHRFFSKATTYHVIVDGLPTSVVDWETLIARATPADGVKLRKLDLTQLTFSELYQRLAELGPHDPVLLIAAYADADGATLPFYPTLERIRRSTDAPIFHPYEHGMGHGVIGGMMVSHFEQGRAAGLIASRILAGEPPSEIPVRESPNKYIVDEALLRRFDIATSQLPKGTQRVGRERSIVETHPFWIFGGAFALALSYLIAWVFYCLWCKQKRATRDLRESEQRHHAMFENTFAPMLVVDPESGRIVDANAAAHRFYGFSKDALLAMRVFDINDSLPEEIRGNLLDAANQVRSTFRLRHTLNNGSVREVEVFAGPIEIRGKLHLFSIVRDISELVLREQLLLQAKLDAEAASRAKSEFLTVMSHEMRTPLNPIVGMTAMMLEEVESPEHREMLRMIGEGADRLASLIDQILQFSKITSGRQVVNPRPLSVPELLSAIIKRSGVPRKGVAVRLEAVADDSLGPVFPARLISDPVILDHVVSNLFDNAIKFTHRGSVSVRYGILARREAAVHVRIEVEDTGIGIAESMLELIFEPFVQADSSNTRGHEGVGLGLSICRRLTELLEGELRVASVPGRGSRFQLDLWMDDPQCP